MSAFVSMGVSVCVVSNPCVVPAVNSCVARVALREFSGHGE